MRIEMDLWNHIDYWHRGRSFKWRIIDIFRMIPNDLCCLASIIEVIGMFTTPANRTSVVPRISIWSPLIAKESEKCLWTATWPGVMEGSDCSVSNRCHIKHILFSSSIQYIGVDSAH